MKEEFLHYVWKMKRFNFHDLRTADGEQVNIIDFGFHNHNAGPDFLNAKVKIAETTWIGHIEIHIKASDWNRHAHQHDPGYKNVVLHVVFENDAEVTDIMDRSVPCVELKDRIEKGLLQKYDALKSNLDWIPCAGVFNQLDLHKMDIFLESYYISRLENKSLRIQKILFDFKNDWESVLFHLILQYMGMKVNNEAFHRLTEVLPYTLLKRYSDSPIQLEGLLLGQAGLLQGADGHIAKLRKEYAHLAAKHRLKSMTGHEWKFLRLRPANFPTIRMAQMASLLHTHPKLFATILTNMNVKALNEVFDVRAGDYWSEHYLPGRMTRKSVKSLGKSTRKSIMINVIAPLFFTYGKIKSDSEVQEAALNLLNDVSSESNAIIKRWQQLGVKAKNAVQSQALIELKTNYCNQFRCLQCSIGQELLFT